MPCHWDFVSELVVLLKAIGGELHVQRPYACCARNLRLSPLYDRLITISNTFGAFWKDENLTENVDSEILDSLGQSTAEKLWLAASMDKTLRLQLHAPSDFWLEFS